jgi:hypothetical protein
MINFFLRNFVEPLLFFRYRREVGMIQKLTLRRDFNMCNIRTDCCRDGILSLSIVGKKYYAICQKCYKRRQIKPLFLVICSKCFNKQNLTRTKLYIVNRFTNEIRAQCKKCKNYFNAHDNTFISNI